MSLKSLWKHLKLGFSGASEDRTVITPSVSAPSKAAPARSRKKRTKPTKNWRQGRKLTYPLPLLEVGECLVYGIDKLRPVVDAITRWKKQEGMEFSLHISRTSSIIVTRTL